MKPRVRAVRPPACPPAVAAAFAIACAASPGAAQAQGAVSIYGVLDMNLERSNHRNSGGATGDLTLLKSDGLFGSRLGFTGSEDLGGGNKALFTLESGIGPDTGAIGNGTRFFNRLSFVGLENRLGRITLGRQYTAQFDVLSRFFPLTRAPQYEPYAQIESIYTENAVKLSRIAGPWKLGAHYGFGESARGSKGSANYSVGAAYEMTGRWGAALSYDQSNTAYATTGNLDNYGYVRKLVAAGRVTLGKATVHAGIRDGNTAAANATTTLRDNIAYIGAEYQATPVVNLAIGYYQNNVHYTVAAYTGTPRSVAARATYSLSKRTDVYLVAGTARNAALNFNPLSTLEPGQTNQSAFALGLRHIF